MQDLGPNVNSLLSYLPFVLAVVGLGMWVGKLSKQSDITSKETEANRQRYHDLSNEFMKYREHVAREYASKDMLTEFKTELIAAINSLGTRLDGLFATRK